MCVSVCVELSLDFLSLFTQILIYKMSENTKSFKLLSVIHNKFHKPECFRERLSDYFDRGLGFGLGLGRLEIRQVTLFLGIFHILGLKQGGIPKITSKACGWQCTK